MHLVPFNVAHHLSDWHDCSLELRCPWSPQVVMLPVRVLLERGGSNSRCHRGSAAVLGLWRETGAGVSGGGAYPKL